VRLAVDNDGLDFNGLPLADRVAAEAARVHVLPLAVDPFDWPDPARLAPRPWLIGVQAQVGYVTAIVSPGGVGKTGYAIGLALSVASGKPLLGHRVWRQGAVWLWNLEDGRDELVRRTAAAVMHHRLDRADCQAIYLNSGRDRPLVMAASDGQDGHVYHPDEEALTREARARDVRLLVIDPFVHSHSLNENDNAAMAAAMAAWGRVAQEAQCAVILVHHTRKGALGGNIEDGRGASAIAAAARVGLTLARMDDETGERFDVPQRDRWRYVRIDDAKASQAPKASRADWIRLASIDLGNGNDTYPSGDSVQVVEPWTPPDVFDGISVDDANRVLDAIDHGAGHGALYSARRGGAGKARWAGNVLVEMLDLNETQAAQVIDTWVKNGVLVETQYRDEAQRKDRTGVRVCHEKRPAHAQ
jgi:hypothetical protein